ncbi:HxlR family transcriptional regulator [Neolewinella xylanilytica]|uniref:HxlR family transcriptional regulator n=1 Tax=Neolewinella xylanilytica TaxID=1514080 RepID=A0A2S6IA49_9BACT|nr:helix-turn-helix domain-containing protein [Neolewinella xylanilytica]PPK88366.1 HxlR family transcriptional regulator [Neolewinella xylanilytica]
MLDVQSPVCKSHHRAMRDTLDVISGKWKLLILSALKERTVRFNELTRELEISPRILSRELKDLERNKLVKRTVRKTRPVTVEYERTAHAATLDPLIEAVYEWGYLHYERVAGTKRPHDPTEAE